MGYEIGELVDDVCIRELRKHLKEFQKLLKATLEELCYTGLNMLVPHLLDHLVNDLQKFGYLEILDASLLERVNVHLKPAFRTTSL